MSLSCGGDRAVRGSCLRALLAVMGVAAILAMASAGTARAAAVSPAVHLGNVTGCADIDPGAHGVNIEAPSGSGTFDDGTLVGTYTVSDDETTFDWASSTVPVTFVVVKGGTDANVYRYAAATSDSGLVSPLNAGDQVPAISHVLLCYAEQPPPPPPAKGRIVIEKKTVPAGAEQQFAFHPSEDLSSSDFLLADGDEKVLEASAGTYTVEELATEGWTLTKLSCDDADSSAAGATATIDLAAGETVVCTFTNTKDVPDSPPVDTPPVDNPPADAPPVDNPIVTAPVNLPPVVTAAAPAPSAAPATPSLAVRGTRVARGTASLRLPGCAASRARVTVSGSPMRRVVFSVNGRRVATVVVPVGRRSVTVSLPVGAVTARVTFRNGASARTLRARTRRCAARTVRPQFTG
jgi:opacity protein-like surface antigen